MKIFPWADATLKAIKLRNLGKSPDLAGGEDEAQVRVSPLACFLRYFVRALPQFEIIRPRPHSSGSS